MELKGYNGTGIKDVVDAAGVPKGSFYSYFDSKEAFAIEAIEKVACDAAQEMGRLLLSGDKPAKERLAEFFQASSGQYCQEEFKIGCFLGNMCQEMAASSERIGRTVEIALQDITQTIQKALEQAQRDGDLDTSFNPALLAAFLFNAWEGALMRMKSSSSREPLDVFCHHLDLYFRTTVTR